MAMRLIIRASGVQNRGPDKTLVALLSKAHDWLTRLTSGRSESILVIARQEKVTTSYLTRLVYLGCLAPDIVDRIAHGQQPPELNAMRLVRMMPLPLDWQEQRKVLGMSS